MVLNVFVHLQVGTQETCEFTFELDVSLPNYIYLTYFMPPFKEFAFHRSVGSPALKLKCLNDFWKTLGPSDLKLGRKVGHV